MLLLAIGVGGGIVLGVFAAASIPGGVIIGAMVGAFVGTASWTVVVPALEHKNLLICVPCAYAPAMFCAIGSGTYGPEVAVPITGFVLTLGLLGVYLWGRNSVSLHAPGFCRECGYDLSGIPADRCPECGIVEPSVGPRRFREPFVILWISVVAAGLGMLALWVMLT